MHITYQHTFKKINITPKHICTEKEMYGEKLSLKYHSIIYKNIEVADRNIK